jgi:hypothetical protein
MFLNEAVPKGNAMSILIAITGYKNPNIETYIIESVTLFWDSNERVALRLLSPTFDHYTSQLLTIIIISSKLNFNN